MLAAQPLVAFVATRDPDRARVFYQETLGLRLVSDEPYALVFDANGTTLRVQKVQEVEPQGFTVLGWLVPDVIETVRALRKRGVAFERYGFMEQDEDGVWTAPGGAKVAWFRDPDGNTLSLTQG
jgi:catechol 2,3-dioxygenase-like lactoylglutathione lyase family enzyme